MITFDTLPNIVTYLQMRNAIVDRALKICDVVSYTQNAFYNRELLIHCHKALEHSEKNCTSHFNLDEWLLAYGTADFDRKLEKRINWIIEIVQLTTGSGYYSSEKQPRFPSTNYTDYEF